MKLDESLYRILVIEDNPGDYLLVEDYLTEHIKNPVLVHVTKFKDATKLLQEREQEFDLVLLDLSLPDINRDELVEEATQLSQTKPVIILTGYADLDFATKSLSLGVSDYLVKDTINSVMLYKSVVYSLERFIFTKSLKESEKRYMELFHLSPAPMWVFNVDNYAFLDVNEAAIRHYGYSKEEFLSMTLKEIRPQEDIHLLEASMANSSINSSAYFKKSFRHKKKNGQIIITEIISNPINYNGKNAEIVLATDITEKLFQLQAIEEQNNRLREIAWTQSHIVRAPVARLMGIIDLLKNGLLDTDEKLAMLSSVFTSAEEIDCIIKDIVAKSQTVINIESN